LPRNIQNLVPPFGENIVSGAANLSGHLERVRSIILASSMSALQTRPGASETVLKQHSTTIFATAIPTGTAETLVQHDLV